jgi:Lipocalin-like domain
MRKLFLGLAASLLLACGGDSTGPNASAAGTWNLQTVNGAGLPATVIFVASPLYRLEILSDTFVANANNTYNETSVVRETDGSTVATTTSTSNGTWTQSNGALTITTSDGFVTTATISGNTITISDGTDVYVYAR